MSSGLLYLVIVGVWACVLLPMWARRSDPGEGRGPAPADMPPLAPGRPHPRILARRRRRLTGTVSFLLVTIVVAAVGWAPWWSVTVPSIALVGYLACLRAAAACDAEQAERDLLSGEQAEQEPEGPETAPSPERSSGEDAAEPRAPDPRVIDFPVKGARPPGWSGARDELFDQYADPPRPAVGD